MEIRAIVPAATLAFVILLAHTTAAVAADVKLLSVVGMRPVLPELVRQFEHATGHKVTIQHGVSAALKRQIEAGEPFDLAILTPALMDDLSAQGKIAGGTRAVIARSAMGVAVRAGAPRPDISSVEAFKRALLNVQSIAYAPEGPTGIHVAKVFERLGIAEAMKAKTKPQPSAERIPQAVAEGEAEFGFVAISAILQVRGVEVLGPFPPELQDYVVFVGGVGAAAKETEAGKALINFLRSESAAAVMKVKGLERVAP